VTSIGKLALFEELLAVFSNSILQKRFLDAGLFFASSHVWNDRSSFDKKKIIGGKVLFSTKVDFLIIYIFHRRCSKLDILNLHRKRPFISIYFHLFIFPLTTQKISKKR